MQEERYCAGYKHGFRDALDGGKRRRDAHPVMGSVIDRNGRPSSFQAGYSDGFRAAQGHLTSYPLPVLRAYLSHPQFWVSESQALPLLQFHQR